MILSIVYDNEAEPGMKKDWGFSCHIETNDTRILFDTGRDGNILLNNMKAMSIYPEEIDIIVLSHAHYDHTGGLGFC